MTGDDWTDIQIRMTNPSGEHADWSDWRCVCEPRSIAVQTMHFTYELYPAVTDSQSVAIYDKNEMLDF